MKKKPNPMYKPAKYQICYITFGDAPALKLPKFKLPKITKNTKIKFK